MARIYGLDPELPPPSYLEHQAFFTPESWDSLDAAIKQALATGRPYELELDMIRCDGSTGWLWCRGEAVLDADGACIALRGVAQDVTERKLAESELLRRKNALDEAQRLAHLGSWEMDGTSAVVTWSDELYRIYGLDPAFGPRPFQDYEELFTPESWVRLNAAVRLALETGTRYDLELEVIRGDGRVRWVWAQGEEVRDPAGARVGLRGVVLDITERKRAEAVISKLSLYDTLTGLANRRRLIHLLEKAIATHSSCHQFGGLLMVNLDSFKTINDTLGHDAGDALLVEISDRLKQSVKYDDIVARFGGDEFVLLLRNLGKTPNQALDSLQLIAQTILIRLEDTYVLEAGSYYSTCSAGTTLFGDTSTTALELIKQLDIALVDAKQSGRNRVSFFDPTWQVAVDEHARLLSELRDGIAGHQFEMYFQAQLDQVGHIFGAEALLRWHHPRRGVLNPAEFLPVAEANGMMVKLGDEIMQLCLAQLQCWQEDPATRYLKLSINITADQFYADGFADRLELLFARHRLGAGGVVLEFTESMLLGNFERARTIIHRLRGLGVSFAIDDFGTGCSSLSYLSELTVEQLKIDQSFVRNIGVNDKDAAIVRAIIDMAQALEMEVLAEGVETAEQHEYLLQHGCRYFQGYLFARPVPLAEFNALLAESRLRPDSARPAWRGT